LHVVGSHTEKDRHRIETGMPSSHEYGNAGLDELVKYIYRRATEFPSVKGC